MKSASADSTAPASVEPLLFFRAAAYGCALPLSHVVETMRPLPIEPMAGLPPCVSGVCVIRGAATPVLDLGALLSGGAPGPAGRFISIKTGRGQAALAVSSIAGIAAPGETALQELPPLLKAPHSAAVEALGALDERLFFVLSAGRLVPEDVWTALSERGLLS